MNVRTGRRAAAWAVLAGAALFACAAPRATQAPSEPEDPAIGMSLGVQDPSGLRVGRWALYSVRTRGSAAVHSTKISVVREEGDSLWIEQRMPVGGQTMVYKVRVDRSGRVQELWGGPPGTLNPRQFRLREPDGRKPAEPADAGAEMSDEDESIEVGGKTYRCRKVTTTVKWPDGRRTTMVTWCSPEVPFSQVCQGRSLGGVVRRAYGPHVMELSATGDNAREELPLPAK